MSRDSTQFWQFIVHTIHSPTFIIYRMVPTDGVLDSDFNIFLQRCQNPGMTLLMFYSHQLLQCSNLFHATLRGDCVFQQYFLDQSCQAGSKRLEYLRRNQVSLRAADYTSLCERLVYPGNTDNKVNAVRVGHLFVLPSAYLGEDRYMRQNMHEKVSTSKIVCWPNIFLTMTCISQWPDIENALLP